MTLTVLGGFGLALASSKAWRNIVSLSLAACAKGYKPYDM